MKDMLMMVFQVVVILAGALYLGRTVSRQFNAAKVRAVRDAERNALDSLTRVSSDRLQAGEVTTMDYLSHVLLGECRQTMEIITQGLGQGWDSERGGPTSELTPTECCAQMRTHLHSLEALIYLIMEEPDCGGYNKDLVVAKIAEIKALVRQRQEEGVVRKPEQEVANAQ